MTTYSTLDRVSELLSLAREKNSSCYLACIALIVSASQDDSFLPLVISAGTNLSRGDVKRAIKIIRIVQQEIPLFADKCENSIQLIRFLLGNRHIGGGLNDQRTSLQIH